MSDVREVHSSDPWWKLDRDSARVGRRVTVAFARRDIQLRYVQTRLGWLWAVVQPVALIAGLTLVLGRVFGLPDEGLRQFGLNLAAALPGWIWFQYIVSQGAPSLVHNQALVVKSAFSHTALPNAKALVGLVDFVVASAVVGIGLVLFGAASPWVLVRLPLIAAFTVVSGLGWAYLIAAVSVRRRDVLSVLPVVLQVLFFVSPVALPSANFSTNGWGILYWVNPAVAIADGFRWAWLDWSVWQPAHAVSFVSGGTAFAVGLLFLRYQSRRITEFL
jgi:lipopolysaccharide transport system permease protein